MSGKKMRVFVLCAMLAASICAMLLVLPTAAKEKNVTKEKESTKEKNVTEEDTEMAIPCLVGKLLLYKGETRYLDIRYVGGASSVKISSSAPSVVSVTNTGKLSANKCGRAVVTVTMKKGKTVSKAELTVTVRYSSFYHTKAYGAKIVKDSRNRKTPLFYQHLELKEGKTSKIKCRDLEGTASVTYKSSKPSVASVDENGNITALKKGKATIKVRIKQNKRVYAYRVAVHVITGEETAVITEKERNAYIGNSGFMGNSLGIGLQLYFKSKGKGFLGGPTMMVKKSYSFRGEKVKSMQYKLTYKGKAYRAPDIVKVSGIKRAFINMGTNDLWQSPDKTADEYIEYLENIRAKNPDVVIFIEAMTPMYKGKDQKNLNNRNIRKLNRLMKAYAANNHDMYYIEINKSMRAKDNTLKPEYCGDRFVHLSFKGYEVWTDVVCAYVDMLLIREQKARDAVKSASESRLAEDYAYAVRLVDKLKDSTVKDGLSDKLKQLKKKGLK